MTTTVEVEHPDWCVIRRSDGRHCDVGLYVAGEHVGDRTLIEIEDGVLEAAVQFQEPNESPGAPVMRIEVIESPYKHEDPILLHMSKRQAVDFALAIIKAALEPAE